MSIRTSHLMENHCNRPCGVGCNDTILTCLLHMILPANHLMSVSPLALQSDSSAYHSAGCGPTLIEQEHR